MVVGYWAHPQSVPSSHTHLTRSGRTLLPPSGPLLCGFLMLSRSWQECRCCAGVRCPQAITVGEVMVPDGRETWVRLPGFCRARVRSACELLDQQAHGEVDAQRADLIIAQVVDDRVRDPHFAAGGLDPGEFARVGAGEVRLDGCLAGIDQQVFQLWPRVEGGLVYVPDQLPGGLPAVGALVGPLEGGYDVLGEIAGELGALD